MRVFKYMAFATLALFGLVSFGFMPVFLVSIFAAPLYSICIRG